MRFLTVVAVSLACASPLAAQDQSASSAEVRPPEIPAKAFAARSQLSGAKLSPDGNQLASRSNVNGMDYVMLYNAANGAPVGTFAMGEGNRLNWVRWAGNQRLLVSASAYDEYNRYWTRLFVVELDTGELYSIGRKEPIRDGDNVIWVAEDGSSVLVSLQANPRHYPSVYRFDLTRDGKRDQVQGSRQGIWNWYADKDGNVRIGTGWYRKKLRVYYRGPGEEDIEMVDKIHLDDLEKENETYRYFDILRVEPDSDIGYVFEENEAGKVGLRRYDLARSEVVDTVYEHPQYDVDGAVFSRDGKPVAVTYTDDSSQVVWLDEKLGAIQKGLEAALEEDTVRIVSRSEDDTRMIIQAGGAADPGALYVYTPAEGTLEALGEMSAGVPFEHLAQPKAITYTARDGTPIRAYLTLPRGRPAEGLPLIINPHGGPYGIRDTLSYNSEVQMLANRGYAVLQPNYRGSGGYGDAFFDLGYGEIGRAMQDDLDDAMDWAVSQGIADPERVCLVGASYGGYAAVWGAIRNPERYRCAASWAGVMDWDIMLRHDRQFFSRRTTSRWRNRYEGKEERDFRLADVSPFEQVERLKRPLLLAHGTDDGIVNVEQYHLMVRAAKEQGVSVDELLIEDEGHGFSEVASGEAWFEALEKFLDTHNPAE
ncbi:prolyl oligopeptidase family serine peptidase [Qipengyuania xiapuensis]|uniref:Prolyl oligopeptidase family serine peptidase n=1 Tax=Qipengyuania xiapuensis TaxID=2867236 RepID=A0ABX8ZTN9_9SPHN|nr:prolyl oligopeptidase family serine peptidase [Qipengyuania xiapuensis]QZD92406.1 prolyl oligopeptidase family serine peptidase [Qipengyuania xiapuensis]